MFHDLETGKTKSPIEGQCLICNMTEPSRHSTLGASFCDPCWEAMKDEGELIKRMVW